MIEILFVTTLVLTTLVIIIAVRVLPNIKTVEPNKKIKRSSHTKLPSKTNNEDYVSNLKIIKLSRKLTTRELAELGEIHESTMSKILNNNYNCNTTLVKEVHNRINSKV